MPVEFLSPIQTHDLNSPFVTQIKPNICPQKQELHFRLIPTWYPWSPSIAHVGPILIWRLGLFVGVSLPEQTNCMKVNSGTPAPIVTLSPTLTHLSLEHTTPNTEQRWRKGQAQPEAKAAHSNKDGKPYVFLLAKPWYVPQKLLRPIVCLYLCCLVFKQAGDYNDDDDDCNDDSDGSGLRRSSCRGVERHADNWPVYLRKGTLWMFKVPAA